VGRIRLCGREKMDGVFAISFVLCVLVVALTVAGVRRDARWLGNAYLIGLSALLVLLTATLAVPGVGILLMLSGVLFLVLAPLLVLVLVVFLLINGFTMVRRESGSLPNLLSLIAGLGIAAVMAASVGVLINPATLLTPLALAAVLGLAYLGFEFTSYVGYAWAYAKIARRVPASHVIVLGSGLRDGRTVGPLLAGRVDGGIEHYRRLRKAGGEPLLVMSGGQGPDEHIPEARAMADYAISRGVPEEHLLVEDQSRTTLENLRFTRALIADRSVTETVAGEADVAEPRGGQELAPRPPAKPPLPWFAPPVEASMLIVTSDYHALRAATYARQLGLPAQAVGSRTARYFWPSAVLREFVAVLNQQRKRHIVLMLLITVPVPLLLALALF